MEFLRSLLPWFNAVTGTVITILVVASLIGVPRRLIVWLAGGQLPEYPVPDLIVVLGGGGMPSESGLIRCYFAAQYAGRWPSAKLMVALPGRLSAHSGSVQMMRDELEMRGVSPGRIKIECSGRNTHEQARAVYQLTAPASSGQTVAVVSSLIHLRRAIWSFEKQGFKQVFGLPAANAPLDTDMGKRQFVRYRFWQNIAWSIAVVRELLALASYKLRGHI